MLTPKHQTNLRNAKEYFSEHLCVGDYYSAGQSVSGDWFGLGAEKLGLQNKVGEKEFLALCEGFHPNTGERLTLRKNTKRQEGGKSVANRRVFYDFAISPPKSVSIVALLQDVRIIDLHHQAVRMAMTEIEKYAGTRVRKKGADTERLTGNLVGAAFRHDTSRELDPHLHTHCVVMNATFDPVENCWKALEASAMYRAQKLVENLYYHELSKGLLSLGYEIENTAGGAEIRGVPLSLIKRFSKRHEQINRETQKRIEEDGPPHNVKSLRELIARTKRRRKIKDSTATRLKPEWEKEVTSEDRIALEKLRPTRPQSRAKVDAGPILAWADEHLFERRSVVHDYQLLSTALAYGRGKEFELADLKLALEARHYVRETGSSKLTSKEVLRCELEIIFAAQDGRSKYAPHNAEYPGSPKLSQEQREAVQQILRSRNFITLFRGAAGTGKSFALKEVHQGLVLSGRQVIVLAPQRQQVTDLEKDGLPAQSLAHLLTMREIPRKAVIVLDEAGQVGGRQLLDLIRLVRAFDGRLILSGDTRQHGAVTASDALRAIEKHGQIKPAEIRTIRRQDPELGRTRAERAFIQEYREAVKAAASGEALDSFERLDRLSCIRELLLDERRQALANDYVGATEKNERALVVAQTWDEVRGVNEAIRERLKQSGKLSGGQILETFQVVDATSAQRRDPQFYGTGQRVFFLQRYGRFEKGEFCEILETSSRGLALLKNGRRSNLSFRYADRIAVAKAASLEVAEGDRLQLKFNGRSKEGLALNNGELVTLVRVLKDGALVVKSDRGQSKTLSPTQRLFNLGYAVTSYASQGKTVDTVLFSDSGNSAATNENQWYVTISRGRKRVVVFTSDKGQLRENIQRAGVRELAVDLNPGLPSEAIARQRVDGTLDRLRRTSACVSTFPSHQATHIKVNL